MDFRGYLRTLRRWKFLIALIVIVCGVTSALVSLQLPKVYKVTSVGLVSPKQLIPPSSGINPNDPNQVPSLDQLVETYVGLVNTIPVRERLVKSGIPRTTDQLATEIVAVRQPSTTLINVSISDADPAVSLTIARNIIPAFNSSLDELQSKVGGPTTHLDSLVLWEQPTAAPVAPVSPDIPRNVLLALAAGGVLGVVIALVIERLDNTIKLENDVQLKLGVPLLGSVVYKPLSFGAKDKSSAGRVEVVAASHPADPISEQYRAIRTNLMFSRIDQGLQTVLVTSTTPGEGKTTTACNLAAVLAQAGNSVILVDADFRRPALHRVFHLPQKVGLGNLILENRSQAEILMETGIPNLKVLCVGPTPPNPSELLGSVSMDRTLTRLKQLADIIVIDTPPVGAVTDATVLGTLVDAVVMVVERGAVGTPQILKSLQTMDAVGANVIGVVLNKARAEDTSAYYYYYGELPGQSEGAADAGGTRGVG